MNVLFICTANVCRSPLAEGYLKALLDQRKLSDFQISSAGVAALTGARAFDCAIEVARKFDFDISTHRARQLTPDHIRDADRIFCMEAWQASAVLEMHRHAKQRMALI